MAYAYVQSAQNVSNANTVTISPTAGNLLVLASNTSPGGGTPTITSVTSNNSVNMNSRVASFANANSRWLTIFELPNVPSGITSFTVTYNGGTPVTCALIILEYSGIATASPFIAGNGGNFQNLPGTGTDAITSGTATTVGTAPALILGIVACSNGNGDTVAGTGFTSRVSGNNSWLVEDKRLTSTGSTQVTATAPTHGGTDDYETFLLAYAEPSAAVASVAWLRA